MEASRWTRLERLFASAEPLPAEERGDFLDRTFAAEPDAELRRELEAMLAPAAGKRVDGAIAGGLALFAESDLFAEGSTVAALEKPPERLGPYLIGRQIGRGGMATVYEAERGDREFQRKVAVKVLRRGMDTDDIVRRLRRERQILANLDHPNIARLLDGGSTPDGRPFVVMELIAGVPIDAYCRDRELTLRQRLELFRQVCAAVHFAHRNLVLHRDIKPSNILVGPDGAPKLLDFGIAKVLQDGQGEDDSAAAEPATFEPATFEHTATGQRLLTPEWASPEQVRGQPLTTASDVYSLGLLLYLLVTGRRAYQVDARNPAELERVVCGEEPPSPQRGDDLDQVILAALRKEPERRYASAEQLGEDLRRYLENLPVLARRDTFGYRAGKFIRRHRLAVAAVLAVFLTLLAAALITAHQARVAREERRKAEENLARAEQVAAFLTGVFEGSDPGEAHGRVLTARDLLDQGVRRMRFDLREDERLRADLLGTMGRVYQKLALYEEAGALLGEAAALREKEGGGAAAASRGDLASLAFQRGRLAEAAALAGDALQRQRQAAAPPREIAKTLKLVADVELALDHGPAAERYFAEALAIQRQHAGPESEEVLATRSSLGEMYYRRGEAARARELFAEVAEIRRRTLGGGHPALATSLNNLAAAEQALGRLEVARDLLREVVASRRLIYGAEHVEVALALNNLATVETQVGELGPAVEHLEEALQIERRLYGGPHPDVAAILHNLGALHQKRKDKESAERLYGEALAMRREVLSAGHPLVAQTLRNLGELYEAGAPAKAESSFRQALEIDRKALPAGDPRIANSLSGLGRLAWRRGEAAAAERLFREELAIRRAAAATDWRLSYAEIWLGRVLAETGHRREAEELIGKALPALIEALGEDHPRSAEALRLAAAVRASR